MIQMLTSQTQMLNILLNNLKDIPTLLKMAFSVSCLAVFSRVLGESVVGCSPEIRGEGK